mmetsp:Transcript_22989/g.29363  ORF Transcript_22989/g.29363 Transcript_22989/m.29363 type:complete len:329 (-) Transcript_22989:1764-2750(-)
MKRLQLFIQAPVEQGGQPKMTFTPPPSPLFIPATGSYFDNYPSSANSQQNLFPPVQQRKLSLHVNVPSSSCRGCSTLSGALTPSTGVGSPTASKFIFPGTPSLSPRTNHKAFSLSTSLDIPSPSPMCDYFKSNGENISLKWQRTSSLSKPTASRKVSLDHNSCHSTAQKQMSSSQRKSPCNYCVDAGQPLCGLYANKCPNRPCPECNGRHRYKRCNKRKRRAAAIAQAAAAAPQLNKQQKIAEQPSVINHSIKQTEVPVYSTYQDCIQDQYLKYNQAVQSTSLSSLIMALQQKLDQTTQHISDLQDVDPNKINLQNEFKGGTRLISQK